MSSDHHAHVKELFLAVSERPLDERRAFLDSACGDDDRLRREVESLLVFRDSGEEAVTSSICVSAAAPLERIGPYRLLNKLGEGGMGEVWQAEQEEPVRRRVALKMIKAGMDTRHVVARFESERQALALMDHPNIARVFDAGANERGRPYFVMEYVNGEPITAYCNRHRLTTRERLELFVDVCAGVHHAHQKGIIHRDIKPSNVLVEVVDGRPVPKIIDFGVAKATQQRLTDKTMFTAMGMLIGTPDYMSPEQATVSNLDIDTRSDVYSLGVVLYRLLTGVLPFDSEKLSAAGIDEIRRAIREDEPSRPSTRVLTLGDASDEATKSRQTDVAGLRRQLSGDLDWITMKAMEKDRQRRYASASDLAADIGQHLRYEPVLANPPSTVYRTRKFVRRHRIGVLAGALVFVALLAGIVGTTVGLVRAQREAETSRRVADLLVGMFDELNPVVAGRRAATPVEMLERGIERVESDLAGQPLIQARVLTTMGRAYDALGLPTESRPVHEKVLALRREHLGPEHPDTLASMNDLANLLWAMGEFAASRRLSKETLALQQKVHGSEHPAVVLSLESLSILHLRQGEFDEARALLERAVRISERLRGPVHMDVARGLFWLGVAEINLGDHDAARRYNERLLHIVEQTLGTEHSYYGWAVHQSADVAERGDPASARALYERALTIQENALGENHTAVADVLRSLGQALTREGDYEAARPLLNRAIQVRDHTVGPQHPDFALDLDALGSLALHTGDDQAARSLHTRALEIHQRALGPDHFRVAGTLGLLGAAEQASGNLEEAIQLRRRQLAILRGVFGADHWRLAEPSGELAQLEAQVADDG